MNNGHSPCIKTLHNIGWTTYTFEGNNLENHLLQVASTLGTPTIGRNKNTFTERIKPMSRKNARASSLSRKFGFDALPLHTDTAHWIKPSRFILLGCTNAGNSENNTLLADSKNLEFSDTEWKEIDKATYRVINGRHSFFSSIFGTDKKFCRFDEGCMKPINSLSFNAMKNISCQFRNSIVEEIIWQRGKVLIIDNWRMLHGRTATSQRNVERELIRIMSK